MDKKSRGKTEYKGIYCVRCGVEMDQDHIGQLCPQCAWEVDNENAEELMPVSIMVEGE